MFSGKFGALRPEGRRFASVSVEFSAHISATFISANTTLRFQTQAGLLKSSKYTRYKTTDNGYDVFMSREMHYKTFHQIYETNYVTKSLYRNIKFYTLKNLQTITLSLNISRLYVYKVSK